MIRLCWWRTLQSWVIWRREHCVKYPTLPEATVLHLHRCLFPEDYSIRGSCTTPGRALAIHHFLLNSLNHRKAHSMSSRSKSHCHTHTRSMIYYYYHYYLIHMCVLYLRHGTTLFKKYNHFFNYLMCASPYHLFPLPTDQLNDQRKQHSFIQFSCTLT